MAEAHSLCKEPGRHEALKQAAELERLQRIAEALD